MLVRVRVIHLLYTYSNGYLAAFETTRPGNPAATIELEHDLAGRLVTQTSASPDGETIASRATYDPAGQLLGLTSPNGNRTFAYDQAGRIATETGPNGAVTYTYDQASQLTRIASGESDVADIGWDGLGRRTSETGSDGSTRAYNYGPTGRLDTITTSRADGSTTNWTLTHDPLGRLAGIDQSALGWDPTEPIDTLRTIGDTRLLRVDTPLGAAGPGDDPMS